ncbi:hypothetical protein [Saccharopolyspora sp. SCSIO 74807]|uniref:hypothetical protein n=1 Tax=Saccharopolyspora sp. SCSIO 74807 TaxID=3118084 RepID=UPI0030D49956
MTLKPSTTWTCHTGDVAFTLTSPSARADAQRRYLDDYLPGPVGDQNLGAFGMTLHFSDAAFARIIRKVSQLPTSRRIESVPGVFLLEKSDGDARCYSVDTDRLEHEPGSWAVRVQDRGIDLYVRHTARKPYSHALRLMREAMLRSYEDHGGVIVHAAGASIRGDGVMICGPRAVGKTTLLTCLTRCTGSSVLSNDRLILMPGQRLIAVPLPVPIGKGTIDAVPELEKAAPILSRPQRAVDGLPATFGSAEKAEFSPREFAAALGASLAGRSRLRTILTPRLTDDSTPARVRELDVDETRRTLTENCFTPHDEFWRHPWLVPRRTTDADLRRGAAQAIDELAGQVPCYEIRFGVRNPLTELDTLLREVVASR